MDQAVLTTQTWLNKTYKGKSGYITAPEDGVTGWGTMFSLISALQIELGITSPTGNFGPTTAATFMNLEIGSTKTNQVYILQGGLFCKGYNPGGFTGIFGDNTKKAVAQLQSDAGISSTGIVNSLLMKSLLSMDAFILLNYGPYNGDSTLRTIQQNLNRNYSTNTYVASDIGLVPCDGIYGRSTNKTLLYALQIEEGIAVPNGVFGPTTKSKCPVIPTGSTNSKFVSLLQYALYCNGFNPTEFNGVYGSATKAAVTKFQSFTCLTADGIAGMQTWASLLQSTGDPTRIGSSCDCATSLTAAKAATLYKNGYRFVGRYLSGKFAMAASEIETIYSAGLSIFPIFEVGGYELSYFNKAQGIADAKSAYTAADKLGFKLGSLIYFAVDFDALDQDVTNAIIPYFTGINETFNTLENPYGIGIYAPRNVCKRVAKEKLSLSSFVCDMSTGFSGNLGYSLPDDWTFDQISTITLGSGDGQIEIDNNIYSGRNYNPIINSYDWRADALNRGWGPITMEAYLQKMNTLLQDSIYKSFQSLLNDPNSATGSGASFWAPGNSDFIALSNSLFNNTTYSVMIGNIQYDTTKPNYMRVYQYDSKGTIHLIDEYRLNNSLTVSDVSQRFVKGAKSGLKLEFFKAIDKGFILLGAAAGTLSDFIALEEQGIIHSNSNYAAAIAACAVQNSLVAYVAAVLGSAITQIIVPEFPVVAAIVGGAISAIAGYFLSKELSSAELETSLTEKLEWVFDKLF